MDERSITAIKGAFIRTQVRQLSAPLEPSTQWRDLAPEPDQGHLGDKVIQDVVFKVNEKIKQHNRRVYSQQSQRHVAEQIETLHWNLATANTDRAEVDAVAVKKEADLTDTWTLESLPEEYLDLHLHLDHQTDDENQNAEAYAHLRQSLLERGRARDALKQNLARYRQLQKLLEPLEDPQVNVQPNLVTRDGELSKELARMRVLLARVTGKASEMRPSIDPPTTTERSQSGASMTNQQKLASLMNLT